MKLKGLLKVALVLLAVSSLFVACDTIAGGKWPVIYTKEAGKVYMQPCADWQKGDERYVAYFWKNTADNITWVDMVAKDDPYTENLYEATVPTDVEKVIFIRMNGSTTENNWSNKWDQTDDLKIPTGDDVLYCISSSKDGKAKGYWLASGDEKQETPTDTPSTGTPSTNTPSTNTPTEPDSGTDGGAVVSEADFKKFTHIAGEFEGWKNTTELNAEKSYKFFATGSKTSFKFTDGTWDFCAITSDKIVELDKEYVITKIGNTGVDNINIENLEKNAEYEVTLTWKDDRAYVKVHATGETKKWEQLETMYFNPGEWLSYDGYVYAWIWGDTVDGHWVCFNDLDKVNGKDYFKLDVAGCSGIIFIRHTAETNESDRWNNTDKRLDETINALQGNYFKITGWDENEWTTLD